MVTAAVLSSNAPPPPLRKYPVRQENQRDSKCSESQLASSWCIYAMVASTIFNSASAVVLIYRRPKFIHGANQIYAHRKPAQQPMGNPQLSCHRTSGHVHTLQAARTEQCVQVNGL